MKKLFLVANVCNKLLEEESLKKNFMVLTVAIIILILSGCASLTKSQFSAPFTPGPIVNAPIKADIAIGEKISGKASSTTIFKIFKLGSSGKYASGVNYGINGGLGGFVYDPFSADKEAAAYDAVTNSNADIILAPEYIIEVTDYLIFSKVHVTVTGYKGTIKGLKSEEHVVPKEVVVAPKVEEPVTPKEAVVAPKVEEPVTPREVAVAPKVEEPIAPKEAVVAVPAVTDKNLAQGNNKQIETKSASEKAVRNLLTKWLNSWKSGDMKTYRSCYAPNFQSEVTYINALVSYKTNVRKKNKKINISIDKLQISADENIATAVFTQHYRSAILKYSGKKKLELRKINDEWKIYREIM